MHLLSSLLLMTLLAGPFAGDNNIPLFHSFSVKGLEETFTVNAGQKHDLRAWFGYPDFDVLGALSVESCCGFQTNDIVFSVGDPANGGSGLEPRMVVKNHEFEFNVHSWSEETTLVFDNSFVSSGASFHDKTVRLTLTMIGENVYHFGNDGRKPLFTVSALPLLFVLGIVYFASPVLVPAAVLAVAILLILRRRSKKPNRGTVSNGDWP